MPAPFSRLPRDMLRPLRPAHKKVALFPEKVALFPTQGYCLFPCAMQ